MTCKVRYSGGDDGPSEITIADNFFLFGGKKKVVTMANACYGGLNLWYSCTNGDDTVLSEFKLISHWECPEGSSLLKTSSMLLMLFSIH